MFVLIGERETGPFVKSNDKDTRSRGGWRLCCYGFRGSLWVLAYTYHVRRKRTEAIPIPLSFAYGALLDMLAVSSLIAGSGVEAGADGVREKVFARGPRCVSLSSVEKEC